MPKSILTSNLGVGNYTTFGLGAAAALVIVSSLSSAKSACFFITRYLDQYGDKIAGDLSVAISRSSPNGGVYLWNRTENADQFYVRYYPLS